jgi:hypothetical protein
MAGGKIPDSPSPDIRAGRGHHLVVGYQSPDRHRAPLSTFGWRYRSIEGSPRLSVARPTREPSPGALLSTVDR